MSLSRLVMMSLVALTLAGPALAQQENHNMEEGMSDGHMMNGGHGDMMPMMREHMEKMQQHMEQMSEASTPQERSAMMQEHMRQMQKHMQMMQQMMGNMHGGGGGRGNMQGEEHGH
ncbi:hypothetical protein [Modicisalibacter xianhensis]|uniref:Signal recognition particle subunit FFH/SRP54 (Srp54) n=1 Tax=Modicisalibacter xianhensis TaxID=442341 RepID=A0A1I3GJD6_9GAMM|nr:hypothetical protein [Halomonas xianhensis]SFI23586.1 hypothetical protein SAMN04487959_13311 [Halomonas xianhensis]